jgi:Ca2+-binding RTX toxin-like protein
MSAATMDIFISAGAGNDTITGSAGKDTIYAGTGSDKIDGGASKDFLGIFNYTDTVNTKIIYRNVNSGSITGGSNAGTTFKNIEQVDFVTGLGNDEIDISAATIRSFVDAGAGNDTITGGASNDSIGAGAGDDNINSGTGNDSIRAGAGNDNIDANTGDDRIDGGEGNDLLIIANATDSVNTTISYLNVNNGSTIGGSSAGTTFKNIERVDFRTGSGNDSLNISATTIGSSIDAGAGNDTLVGGAGNDRLEAGTGNDTLNGGAGNDRLTGGGGNDVYGIDADVDLGTDTINEVALTGGTDTLDFRSTSGKNIAINLSLTAFQIVATDVNVVIPVASIENVYGGALGDAIIGNSLNNTILGGIGNDVLFGRAGNDILFGEGNNDELSGEAGNDILSGGAGNDFLYGGADNDFLSGDAGSDVLEGGAGNDAYRIDADVETGTDRIFENALDGTDTLDFRATTGKTITVNLNTTTLQIAATDVNLVIPVVSIENVFGGALGDGIIGNSLNNTILGGFGNDFLFGGAGNDLLFGEGNNDELSGEAGNDLLFGGADNDFLFGGIDNDFLSGGAGNDFLEGGAGNDVYRIDADVETGTDRIFENALDGTDTLDFRATTGKNITVNLNTTALQIAATDVKLVIPVVSIENVYGGALGDKLEGNSLSNLILGGGGNDTLTGAAGNDNFYFGGGVALIGAVTVATLLGKDTISDFGKVAGNQDKILLSKTAFTKITTAVGGLTAANFASFATDALALASTSTAAIFYSTGTGNLFYNQNGATAGFGTNGGNFTTLTTKPALAVTDFSVVA